MNTKQGLPRLVTNVIEDVTVRVVRVVTKDRSTVIKNYEDQGLRIESEILWPYGYEIVFRSETYD